LHRARIVPADVGDALKQRQESLYLTTKTETKQNQYYIALDNEIYEVDIISAI
jgi:hypothetical protein